MSLFLEKGYEAVTVNDICEAANVGRSTFYAHYTGKDDLKRSGLDTHLRQLLVERQKAALAKPGQIMDRSLGFSLTMFEHARDHLGLYRALVGGTVVLGTIRQILSDLVRDELAAPGDWNAADAAPRELIVHYVVGAYMAVLTWWLDRGAKLPPERIDAMFRHLWRPRAFWYEVSRLGSILEFRCVIAGVLGIDCSRCPKRAASSQAPSSAARLSSQPQIGCVRCANRQEHGCTADVEAS